MKFLQKCRLIVMDALGFSKIEANGFILLVFIILLVALIPKYFDTHHNQKITLQNDSLALWAKEIEESMKQPKQENQNVMPVAINPNVASIDELKAVGIPSFLAQRIVNYRNKGGVFNKKEDLKKIYGFQDFLYEKVKDAIHLEQSKTHTSFVKKEKPPDENTIEKADFEIKDLNTAQAQDLEKIKGIGKVLSQRIIKYRDVLGGFYESKQLSEVYGLDEEVIKKINLRFQIGKKVNTLSINTDSFKLLIKHPYIDYNLAKAIINYKAVHGFYESIEEIKKIKLISDSLFQKLNPYLSVSDPKQ